MNGLLSDTPCSTQISRFLDELLGGDEQLPGDVGSFGSIIGFSVF